MYDISHHIFNFWYTDHTHLTSIGVGCWRWGMLRQKQLRIRQPFYCTAQSFWEVQLDYVHIYIYTYVYNYSHTMCIYTMIKYLSKLSIRYTKNMYLYKYIYVYIYIYMYKLWKLALSLHSLASSGRWSAHSCHPLHDDDNILERICPAHLAGQLPGVYTWRVYSDHLF